MLGFELLNQSFGVLDEKLTLLFGEVTAVGRCVPRGGGCHWGGFEELLEALRSKHVDRAIFANDVNAAEHGMIAA
jgi:hypothetical protein